MATLFVGGALTLSLNLAGPALIFQIGLVFYRSAGLLDFTLAAGRMGDLMLGTGRRIRKCEVGEGTLHYFCSATLQFGLVLKH